MAIQIDGDSGVSGVNGSATTPALQGTDSNTGIVFGTDQVQVATGGSTRATVDSSGRLLVGNTSSMASSSDVKIEAVSNAGGEIHIGRNDTSVTSGNAIGVIRFYGNDSNGTYQECARINCQADGTHATGDKPSRITFSTTASGASSSTERLRIESDGTLRISSGFGIDFSEIQTNASGMTSETLDSYEEGAFTPTYSSGLTSPSYTGTSGNYTKIGNLVTVTIRIRATGTNASSHLQIAGLPFTSGSSMQEGSFSFGYADNISGSSGSPVMHVPTNGTSMQFYNQDGSNWDGNSGNGVSGRTLHIRGFYFV